MTLGGLPQRMRELGRLRTGEKGTTVSKKTGKEVSFPVKRTTWRLTSPSAELLAVAADLYGGEVDEWLDSPGEGKQYQLATEADSVSVLIPLSFSLSQHWELWKKGGCERRCDGTTNLITDSPCICPADIEERIAAASAQDENGKYKDPTGCKPTTRLSVLLPDIPDLGVWRLEAHGYNAAIEIPGTLAILAGLLRAHGGTDALIPARLRIDPRTQKKGGETRHFTVPVIETPSLSPQMLMSGQSMPTQIGAGDRTAAVPALGAGAGQGDVSQPPPAPPQHEPFTEADEKFVGVEKARKFVDACDQNGLDPGPLVELVTQGRTTEPAYVFIYEWDELRSIFADAQQKRAS